MEQKDVLINIRGVYNFEDEESDVVELFTTGTYTQEGDAFLITYQESEATGFEGSTTTLRVESEDRVTLSRSGPAEAQLIVQNGVRHQCYYDVGYGDMMIGVSGQSIRSNLGESGGDLEFRYALDVNALLASENEMFINVKERLQ